MTHNCQTILQPPLTPVSHCTVPLRTTRGEQLQKLSCERDQIVLERIKRCSSVSQAKIQEDLMLSCSAVSLSLMRLRNIGLVELTVKDRYGNGARNFYSAKEFTQ